MKICLLTIATNKYTNFVNPLYQSVDSFFCNEHDVTCLLFTNKVDFVTECRTKVKILPIEHEPWPNMTLKRYNIFCKYENEIKQHDYVYYCDADMRFVAPVKNEIFSERVVTLHPGFYNKSIKQFSYETNPNSTAFIPLNKGRRYYAGGFNGGTTTKFMEMSHHIANNVDIDLRKNIIAKWHDESHLNHYYNIVTRPTLQLSPSYCYPESWNLPFPKKLLALDKNHKEYRSEE